jgi:hypothetical protein
LPITEAEAKQLVAALQMAMIQCTSAPRDTHKAIKAQVKLGLINTQIFMFYVF